jgi:hypothetical protein
VVGSLLQMMTSGNYYDVVSVAHVMQTADNSIIEHCFMSHAVTVTKERIPPLLVIGYHSLTDHLHQQVGSLVLGQSIHRLPQ